MRLTWIFCGAKPANILVIFAAVSLFISGATAAAWHRSLNGAEIVGDATECWEGKPRPVPDLRVYILSDEEAPEVHSAIKKIGQIPPGGANDSVQEFLKAYDGLVTSLKAIGETARLTRTDKFGRFHKTQLKVGEKYLVVAIDWDKGDSDEMAYYAYFTTGSLNPGLNKVRVYMGPGRKEDCRAN